MLTLLVARKGSRYEKIEDGSGHGVIYRRRRRGYAKVGLRGWLVEGFCGKVPERHWTRRLSG